MKDTIVVYMDASIYEKEDNQDNEKYIGLGIYIIDENGNDTKICKGFKTNNTKLKKSSDAELFNLIIFQEYINNNIEYMGKKIIVYTDSEDVVKVLNDKNNQKSFGFKKNIRQKINQLNIIGAYWVKGHAKEKGNNFVDVMAYNSMRKALDNGEEFESISHNKTLGDILGSDLKRVKSNYWEITLPENVNKELYDRAFETEKNVIQKIDSDHYKEKIVLLMNDDHYLAEISLKDGVYSLNEKEYKDKNLKDLVSIIFINKSILKEMYKDDRKILIRFKDKDLEKQFNDIYQEASSIFEEVKNLGQYKKESKEKLREMQNEINGRLKTFEETSDIHFSALRLSKNNQFVIENTHSPKRKMEM